MKIEEVIKQKKFKHPLDRATINIMYTAAWLDDRANSFFKGYGLSQQQYNVLRILKGQKGEPANLFTIQDRMIHKMSNATRLVEKLRLKGLVSRGVCEENRRKIEVTITAKGLSLLEEIEDVPFSMAPKMSEEDLKQLGELLDKFREE